MLSLTYTQALLQGAFTYLPNRHTLFSFKVVNLFQYFKYKTSIVTRLLKDLKHFFLQKGDQSVFVPCRQHPVVFTFTCWPNQHKLSSWKVVNLSFLVAKASILTIMVKKSKSIVTSILNLSISPYTWQPRVICFNLYLLSQST